MKFSVIIHNILVFSICKLERVVKNCFIYEVLFKNYCKDNRNFRTTILD